jgi:hypothetical protein
MTNVGGRGSDWQSEIRRYDQDGPGVCGYYLDLVAMLASLCPLTVEVQRDNGEWIKSDDAVLNTLLTGYQSPLHSQADLVALHVRHREAMGEAWLVDSEQLGWAVLTVPNVTVTKTGISWTDHFGRTRITPKERVWKSWQPDPYSPWLPTSPLRRARPELRRLNAAIRNQIRSAESRLVMNGLLAFPDESGGARPLATQDGDTSFQGVDQVLDDYLELAKAAFHDDDSPAANVPFPYIGPRAEYVELGRGIDGGALQVEEKALEGFARAVNFPAQLLTMGPGSSNHWNEWLLEESQRKMGLAPKLIPVCADITEFYLRPIAARAKHRIGDWSDVPLQRIRVGFDTSFLTSKPDTTSQMLSAWTQGIASREEVASALGIGEMLTLPGGMSDYEHWQLATSKPGAPYADVNEEGNLAEAPNLFGDMGAPPPMGAPPAGEPVAELPAVAEFADSGEMGAANQAPPPPPPQLAALPPDSIIEQRVLDRLYNADIALESALTAQAEACVEQVTAHVAREIIKAHPSRSSKRTQLRSLPVEAVWLNADPNVRAQFPLQATVEDAVDECQSGDAFQAAAVAAAAALALLGDEDDIGFDLDLGQMVLTALIIGFILNRVEAGKGSPRFPSGFVRTSMAAAGGAAVNASITPAGWRDIRGSGDKWDGGLVRSPDGTPVPSDGGTWTGNTGMTTGNKVAKRILKLFGRDLKWEWRHAFYRNPVEPFLPHKTLDGQQFDTPGSVPGGFFPGDHPWCTCALLPKIVRK